MNIRTEMLPTGSVVQLNGGEKRLMIIGVKQTNEGGAGKEYDYLAVLYPEGYVGEKMQYVFNHGDIAQVFFRGYEDEERNVFVEKLATVYDAK